ncbi:hypothetical protein [Shewanella waksmanii]|uniref:hypothetical protein n=1 Tax=Shewanella waksmanii TaxID=213783 RepID=UPI00048C3438|nr:hypothetical protein [Shewanella waksmanii]
MKKCQLFMALFTGLYLLLNCNLAVANPQASDDNLTINCDILLMLMVSDVPDTSELSSKVNQSAKALINHTYGNDTGNKLINRFAAMTQLIDDKDVGEYMIQTCVAAKDRDATKVMADVVLAIAGYDKQFSI